MGQLRLRQLSAAKSMKTHSLADMKHARAQSIVKWPDAA
jgi:hypothetical protein